MKIYEFIIAENVPVGAEVGTGYSCQCLNNPLDVPADLVQIARNSEHVRFEWRASIRAVQEMEQIETTNNNGRIDVGFTLDGVRYIARSVAWSEADLDDTSQDFKSEFYQNILDSHLYEKV